LIEAVGGSSMKPLYESTPHIGVLLEDLHPDRPEATRNRGLDNCVAHWLRVVVPEGLEGLVRQAPGFLTLDPATIAPTVFFVARDAVEAGQFESILSHGTMLPR
jgi:hypothetical protein